MVRPSHFPLVVSVLVGVAGAAHAQPARPLTIPPGRLDEALSALGRQAGIDIGGAEPGLGNVRVTGLRATLPPRAALDRLLAGTPFVAVPAGSGSYRIMRRRVAQDSGPARRRPPLTPPSVTASGEVVVTASKVDTPLLRFPGSVMILPRDGVADVGAHAGPGFSEVANAVPVMQTTGLGPGRDKLFVRGVADSSFLGPTQSTATVYFGDVQLGYNGPDPNLNLYDVDKIEILEGPQGTLYGAGSIGGTVRVSPRAPDLDGFAGNIAAGMALTQHGAPSYDIAGMLNVPILADRVGLRLVGYDKRDGGYIDDIRRNLSNVNRVRTSGGRATLRAAGPDWSIELGGVAQFLSARDSQYAEAGMRSLSRQSVIAQPFEQDYLLGRLVMEKHWDNGIRLLSATGVVHHTADDRFDYSRREDVPQAYDTRNRGRLYTQELRLSQQLGGGRSWLVGLSALRATDGYTRVIGPLATQRDIIGVSNRAVIGAVFGEATVPLTPRLSLTGGGRFSHARIDGEPVASRRVNAFLRGDASTRFDPTAALSWLAAPGWALFARYQSGFRTGGIAVATGVGRVAVFDADAIHVGEVGVRKVRTGARGLAGSASLSYADWNNVQADLVTRTGAPYTANVGTARIKGIELMGNWIPAAGWRADLAVFLNDGRITDPAPDQKAGGRLPDSPKFSSNAEVSYRWTTGGGDRWRAYAGWRRVGRSRLGTLSPLDLPQGGYSAWSLGGSWTTRRLELSATLDNMFDARGNRFASGNAVGLGSVSQYTPLRPRTLRLGVSVPFGSAMAGADRGV